MEGRLGGLLAIWVYERNDHGADDIDSVSCVRTYFQVAWAQFS